MAKKVIKKPVKMMKNRKMMAIEDMMMEVKAPKKPAKKMFKKSVTKKKTLP